MGNSESTYVDVSSNPETRINLEKYEFKGGIHDDPRFGTIDVYKDKTKEDYFVVNGKTFINKAEYEDFMEELKVRFQLRHKNLLRIYAYKHGKNTEGSTLCGESYRIKTYSEYHVHNLQREYDNRAARRDYIVEEELWYLINAVGGLGAYFQERGIYHGDIKPLHLSLTNEGKIKLADHGIINPGYRNNYHRTIADRRDTFISPEALAFVPYKQGEGKYDVFKNDVYGLGMTTLYAANLKNPISCYDFQKYKINNSMVEDLIQEAGTRYSPSLITAIRKMLNMEPNKRPDFRTLLLEIGKPMITKSIMMPISPPSPVKVMQSPPIYQSVIVPTQAPTMQAPPPLQTSFIQAPPVQQTYLPSPPIQTTIVQPPTVQSPPPMPTQSRIVQAPPPMTYSQAPVTYNQAPPMQYQSIMPQKPGPIIQSQVYPPNMGNIPQEADLDRRVNEAIKKSDATIKQHGVSKFGFQ